MWCMISSHPSRYSIYMYANVIFRICKLHFDYKARSKQSLFTVMLS